MNDKQACVFTTDAMAESQPVGILGILDTEEHFPIHPNWGTNFQNHTSFWLIYKKNPLNYHKFLKNG